MRVLLPSEKTTVVYQEAGHTVVGLFLEHVDPAGGHSLIPQCVCSGARAASRLLNPHFQA